MHSAYRYWIIEWHDGAAQHSNRFSLREGALHAIKRLCADGYAVTIKWHTPDGGSQEAHYEPASSPN